MNPMNQPPNKCQTYLNLNSPLSAISTSPDQSKIIVAGRDIVKIVSMQNNEFKVTNNLRAGKTQSLNYTGNDCCWHPSLVENYKFLIATAATNGAVVIWNTVREGSKSVERVFTDHSRAVNKLAWHPDKLDCILTGSQDNTLRMWDIRDAVNASKITFAPKSESVRDVQFNPTQSNQFAAAFDNGTIQLWDIRKPTVAVEKITSHQGLVLTIDWHPEERNIIASGGRDRAIRVWDFSNGRSLNNVSTISSVSRIKWRPGNKWHIASCSSIVDFNIHVWDVKKPYIPVLSFTDHRDVPTGLIWKSPTSLISCSKDSNLLLNEFQDAFKPYKHIRTTGISWNSSNEIASINDKINRNQISEQLPLLSTQFPSFFASFNVPTPPPPPPLVKVEQGIMNIYSPKSDIVVYDEKYLFEYYAKNYLFRGHSFNQLCEHNEAVSLSVNQYHISKMWSLIRLYYNNLDQIQLQKQRKQQQEEELLQQQQEKQQLQKEKEEKEEKRKKKKLDKANKLKLLLQQQQQLINGDDNNNEFNNDTIVGEDKKDNINNGEEKDQNNVNVGNDDDETETDDDTDETETEEEEEEDKDYDINITNSFDGQMVDIFDPSNDMMSAKEPPSGSSLMEFNATDTSNDQFYNILSAEAVTPLVSLPTRAPSLLERQKSSDNILADNIGSLNIKDKKDNNNNNNNNNNLDKKGGSSSTKKKTKIIKNNKNNNSNSSNNNKSSTTTQKSFINKKDKENKKRNNSINNNSSSSNNNSNNNSINNSINDEENQEDEEDDDDDDDELKVLEPPCFEFEEFDFQPILIDMLESCIEKGDVQTCVFIVLIVGKYIELKVEKHRLTQWFGSYIELLQRYKMWSLALEIMKYCDDSTINQASKRHTSFISACSSCGKSIPQNSLICEKCNKASSKCSICRLPVKGMWVWCQGCGHGGHLDHMKSWFIDNNQKACPTGCSHICTPFKK